MRILRSLWIMVLAAALCWPLATSSAFAYGEGTPDTDPPAEEAVCDDFGGRLWGLCVAYCEAQDCPVSEHPSCARLRAKFMDITGSDLLPCDVGPGGGPIG